MLPDYRGDVRESGIRRATSSFSWPTTNGTDAPKIRCAVGRPIVTLLRVSTDTILRVFGVRQVKQPAVTLEEIKVLLEQGADEGVFDVAEHEMVTNVLNLDDRHVGSVLTPRSDIVFLDVRDALDVSRQKLRQASHSVLPLCDGGLDHVSRERQE